MKRKSNPLNYVITVMSQRTGAIGYWDGKNYDDDLNNALRVKNKEELESLLKKLSKILPKGWVIGLQPVPDIVRRNPVKRKTRTKKNPVKPASYAKIKEAIERFQSFTGMTPEHLDEYIVEHPDVALHIGTLDAVSYTTIREGHVEKYEHKFKKNARPLLCSSYDGKQLVILGGVYTFTDRGIVDEG